MPLKIKLCAHCTICTVYHSLRYDNANTSLRFDFVVLENKGKKKPDENRTVDPMYHLFNIKSHLFVNFPSVFSLLFYCIPAIPLSLFSQCHGVVNLIRDSKIQVIHNITFFFWLLVFFFPFSASTRISSLHFFGIGHSVHFVTLNRYSVSLPQRQSHVA